MSERRDQDPDLDARLAELMSDAVSDVEPGDALDAIRNRTKVTPMSSRRPWIYAVGGAAVATAAVITAIAFAGDNLGLTTSDDPGVAGQSSPTGAASTPSPDSTPSENASDQPTSSPEPGPAPRALAVYFVGETPQGPRLYREFQQATTADPAQAAAELAVTGANTDPDYYSPWPDGARVATATYDGDVITVNLEQADGGGNNLLLHDRPAGMSEADAAMAVQQVIYTVQAAVQKGRPGVQFLIDGQRTDQVLGVPASEPLADGPVLDTLSLVSLTTPEEGATVSGTLKVEGVANSFEANVIARLQRYEGTEIVAQLPFTAEGWMEPKLFPFSGEIDLSDVPPGKYVLMVMTDDPSGGAEGNGAFTDTRIVVVE